MSNTQFAFLKKIDVPVRATLQSTISSLGFDLQLDPGLNLLTDTGFSPCVLNGVPDVGFELFLESTQEMVKENAFFAAFVGDSDICIGMSWGGSMKDCASAMIVSCALAQDYGAVISYEGEPPEPLDSLLQGALGVVQDAAKER